jgi:hypothetical protein
MKLFTQTSSRKEYLDRITLLIQETSDCRCVGLRLLDDQGNIPLESYVGYNQEFWNSENWLSVNTHQCACIRVVTGQVEPQDLPAMTPGGSFFCPNIHQFVAALTGEERSRFRGFCATIGFYTMIIVPIRHGEKLIGAIHLADQTENKVPLKTVQFIESLAPLIGESVFWFRYLKNN